MIMKKNDMGRNLPGLVLVLLLCALPSLTIAAENRHLDTISRVLEASTLQKAEQAGVSAKAAVAMNAGVPGEDIEIIVSRSVKRGADAGTINRFLDTSVSAKKEGLPVGPVLDRIEQGLAKGVPVERIAAASERLREKLAVARPVVEALIRDNVKHGTSGEREKAIEATARALEKSISPEELAGIGAAVKSKQGSLSLFTSAANAATYFAGSGISGKTATRLVHNAVEKGYSGRDLDGMIRRVDEEMRRGAKAEDVATRMEGERMNAEGNNRERQDMHEGMRSGPGGAGGMGGMGGGRRR